MIMDSIFIPAFLCEAQFEVVLDLKAANDAYFTSKKYFEKTLNF